MFNKIKSKINKDFHLKELLTGSVITFFTKMFGMLLGYFLIFLISKKNGAEGVGFYSLFNQVLTVLSMVIGLGMNVSVLRFVGQFNNKMELPKIHLLYKYIVGLVIPFGIVSGILLFVGADLISSWLGKGEEYSYGIRLMGFILPFFSMNQVSVEFIRGFKKLQISELVRSVTRPAIMVIIILIFWSKPLDNIAIIYAFIAGSILNSFISSATIWLQLGKIPKDNSVKFELKELFKTSLPMMWTSISSALLATFPMFIIDYFSTESELGIYSVAFRISQAISLILVIMNTIAAPKFAELFYGGEKEKLQKLITQSAKIMLGVSFLLAFFIIVNASWILNLFGSEFEEGKWVLIILVIGQLISTSTGSVGVIMNMSGNQKTLRSVILAVVIVSFIIYLIVSHFCYSIFFVAIISAFTNIFLNIILSIYVKRKLGLTTYFKK
jgi:O-antigen/teichoic acid export membrane protein